MKESKIVLATSTLYQYTSEVRFGLAMRMLLEAANQGYTVVVSDSSPENVQQTLKSTERYGDIQVIPCSPEYTMGKARRLAIEKAMEIAGPDGIGVYVDAERYPMIPLIRQAAQPILRDEADLVIVGRKSLASYPRIQQLSEEIGIHFFAAYTGFRCDAWLGTRIFNAEAAKLFCNYDGRHGDRWDAIFIPVVEALATNLRVTAVWLDYENPTEQTRAETGDIVMYEKRRTQLNVLVEAIAKEAKRLGLPRR